MELHAGEPGSDVEYVWKHYRDHNQNGILVYRPDDSDGFFAAGGDPDTAPATLDLVLPAPGSDQAF